MTEKQYKQYEEIKKEIDNLEVFLFSCGVKYRKTTGRFPTKLIRRGEKVKMYNGCNCRECDISPPLFAICRRLSVVKIVNIIL